MAFTPSNLSIMSIGSGRMIIATSDASTASRTDLWTSGIPDIQAVIPVYTTSLATGFPTDVSFAVSFTQSTGTIHIVRNNGMSASGFNLLVMAGFSSDMTW